MASSGSTRPLPAVRLLRRRPAHGRTSQGGPKFTPHPGRGSAHHLVSSPQEGVGRIGRGRKTIRQSGPGTDAEVAELSQHDMIEQTPAPTQTRWQRLAEFLFFVVLMLLLVFAALPFVDRAHWLACPSDTFLAGTFRPDLQELSWVAAATATCFVLEYWLIFLIPPLEEIFGNRIRRNDTRHPLLRHLQSNLSLAVLVAMVPLIFVAAFSNYCLRPGDIQFRTWPWADTQHYRWPDVVGIQTACWRGARGAWPAAYVFIMNDGATLNIMDSLRRADDHYPELDRALENVDFMFDSRGVSPRCGRADANLLRMRP